MTGRNAIPVQDFRILHPITFQLLLVLTAMADQPGEISGHIVDASTGQSLGEVAIILEGSSRYTTTDAGGAFTVGPVEPGTYRLYITRVGYASLDQLVHVQSGAASRIELSLQVSPGRLDPVVVTASRVPSVLHRSSVSAHVVDNRNTPVGLQTTADLVRHLPGVDIFGGGAPGLVSGMSIRGTTPSQTLVLVDGMRLNAAGRTSTLGGVDLSEISIDGVERVEVTKGPASALYGGDAGGGVIHIFTIRPRAGPHTDLSVITGGGPRVDDEGAFAIQRYHLQHSRSRGSWGWLVDGSLRSTGGHLENTDSQSGHTGLALTHHRDEGRTAFQLHHSRRRGGAPGAEGLGQFGAFDIDDRQNDDVTRFAIRERRPLNNAWQFEASAGGQLRRVERLNPIIQKGELAGDFISRHRLWLLEPRAHWTGARFRPLTVGAELRIEGQRDGQIGEESARVAALYGQNRFTTHCCEVEVGIRLDDHSLYGMQLSPRISGAWRVVTGIVVHGAFGRAFVAPEFDDLFRPTERFREPVAGYAGETGNRDLKPERVWAGDVGLRWLGHLQGEAVFYWSRYRNLFHPAAISLATAGEEALYLTVGNLTDAYISGLELSNRARLWSQSELLMSYTIQRATGVDASRVRRELPGRLREKLSGNYSTGANLRGVPLTMTFRVEWQERYFDSVDAGRLLDKDDGDGKEDETGDEDDEAGALIGAPGSQWRYLTLGCSANAELTRELRFQIDFANLLDERYQSVFGIPQPGLLVSAGLKLKLR